MNPHLKLIMLVIVWQLPVIQCICNIDAVVGVTANLTHSRHFHNFLLFHSHTDSNWQNLSIALQKNFAIPTTTYDVNVRPQQRPQFRIAKDFNTNSLVYAIIRPDEIAEQPKLMSNKVINLMNSTLTGVHNHVIVLIVYDIADTDGNRNLDITPEFMKNTTHNLFGRLFQLQFLRAVILISNAHSHKLIAYFPFPQIRTMDITSMNLSNSFVIRKVIRNARKQVLNAVITDSPPRTMIYVNEKGETKVSGTFLSIALNFVDYINGTFVDNEMNLNRNTVNITTLLNLLGEGKLDFLTNALAVNRRSYYGKYNMDAVTHLYPYYFTRMCLMVPCSKEIPQYLYTYLPFNPRVWGTLIAFIFYITAIKIILLKLSPSKNDSKFIGSAFSTSLCEVFFLPAARHRKYNLTLAQMLIIIFPYSLGFILSNVYMTKLSSYLTISIFEPQINTLDDFVKSKYKMACGQVIKNVIMAYEDYRILESKIEIMDKETKANLLYKLNESYAYPSDNDVIDFFLNTQKYAFRPIFRKSDICFQSSLVGFFIRTDSVFEETFNDFILRISQTGLQYAWEKQTYFNAYLGGKTELIYMDNSLLRRDLLRLNNVLGAFMLWGAGCFFAFLVLICERILFYVKINYGI